MSPRVTVQGSQGGNVSEPTVVPPVLYVPVHPPEPENAQAVLLPMGGGKQALVAYTALDRLAKGCGEGQSWTLVYTSALAKLQEEAPFDAVAFDVEFPGGLQAAIHA